MEWLLEATFPQQNEILTLSLRASKNHKEQTIVQYNAQTQTLLIDKKLSGPEGKKNKVEIPVKLENQKLHLRLFLDHSSLEVFANHGAYVASNRIYPSPNSIYYDINAKNGDIDVTTLEIYSL